MRLLIISLFIGIFIMPFSAFADLVQMQKEIDQLILNFEKYVQYTGNTLVKASTHPAFKDYFLTSDPSQKTKLKHKIDFLSLGTQSKFNIDEMCLIDKKGQEISRIVYQEIAPEKDLSSEEASAPFFSPAFNKSKGNFHLSAPYVSADSLRWVLCFATPIVLDDGSKPGIYHFEISQYIIQGLFNKGLTANSKEFLLLVNKEGYVVSDSRNRFKLEFNVSDTEMKTPFSDYFPKFNNYVPGISAAKIQKINKGKGWIDIEGETFNYLYLPIGYNNWTAILFHPRA